ncbi:ABC transporter [Paenibacillaceae bacterium]|nr:ABC transporter [Paenibacillaceae bacterium]
MFMLKMSYYSLLRMLREPIGPLLLVVLPLVIISILGIVLTGQLSELEGVPRFDWTAITTIIAVQFFGGSYLMSYLNDDLLQTRKWRIRTLPLNIAVYSSSLVLACTLFSTLQGAVMVLFTKWVFGVQWGNLGWVLLVLLIFSLLSQFAHLILVLSVKSAKLAERLSEVIGLGFLALTGIMFPLPNNGFFHFMATYGNPVGLGQMAILEKFDGGKQSEAHLAILLLLAVTALLIIISAGLGRRKLV